MIIEHEFLLAIGGILLLGMATDFLGKRTFLPRVTLLLIFGIVIGPEILNIIPQFLTGRFELISDMALIMIGFLIGGKLTVKSFRRYGRSILLISLVAALTTWLFVLVGLIAIQQSIELSILLACLATATAPAAVVDVIVESGDKSTFSHLLLSIVALDDAWALILFSISLSLVAAISGHNLSLSPGMMVVRDIGGAVLLGLFLGLPAAYLTGRIKPGQPMLTEALGLIFVCGGLALYFDISFLVSSMIMGSIIANLAKHHDYPFHAIEGIEWPIMAIFFVVAGATLELSTLASISLVGIAFIVLRTAGKVTGAWLGGVMSGSDRLVRQWIGWAMLPQAGAPIGMALVAANAFPEYRQVLLSVMISTTIIFEVVGPASIRVAINRYKRGEV